MTETKHEEWEKSEEAAIARRHFYMNLDMNQVQIDGVIKYLSSQRKQLLESVEGLKRTVSYQTASDSNEHKEAIVAIYNQAIDDIHKALSLIKGEEKE